MKAPVVSLLYLDRYHLGDPLFLQALGQSIARTVDTSLRPIIIHGQGDEAQKRLEGQGIFIEAERDVYTGKTEVERHIIETAHRELNRRLVSLLTESIVPAVGFMGADRNLVRVMDEQVRMGGGLTWLRDILDRRVVPVIGTTARDDTGEVHAVDPVALLRAFADDVKSAIEIVMFTTNNLGGIMRGRDPIDRISVNKALEGDVIADRYAAETLVLSGHPVLLTNTVRYPGPSGPRGTWLAAMDS